MKIVIGHLFYDLLNLYGESGNILALKNILEEKNYEVEIKELSLEDEVNFEDLDFIYIGSGTDENEYIALDYLKQYKNEIVQQIENNKIFLVTGNAIELFGKEIILANNEKKEGLNIFEYYTEKVEERIVSECKYKCDFLDSEIIGFANHNGTIKNIENSLFSKIDNQEEKEGIIKNNFYGTYTIGPILARNRKLLEYLVEELIKNKKENFAKLS